MPCHGPPDAVQRLVDGTLWNNRTVRVGSRRCAVPARGADGQLSILGTRVLRTEDPKFLTTGGVYTEDVVDERLGGACHVFFVRSPLAHARIVSVDVSAALEAIDYVQATELVLAMQHGSAA